MKTVKIYHTEPYKTRHITAWVPVSESTIGIAESVAFAEGGGQVADRGLIMQGNVQIAFVDAQRTGGRTHRLLNFPSVTVEDEIRLTLAGPIPDAWDTAVPLTVQIDVRHRYNTSRSHTAGHLVWASALQVFGDDLTGRVRGARVDPEGGRFDILMAKPTQEDRDRLEAMVGQFVRDNLPIRMIPHPSEPECLRWECAGRSIPCGGTHVPMTGEVGRVAIGRKNKGAGLERITWRLLDEPQTEAMARYEEQGAVVPA